ncbi:peptidase S8/S53 domain-containing protein [Tricharina praecox]|uniref:peptidase S8/S53 domain-containing protein n=1 Tax=Tricharina praecox TaxID=43433 RepID=UPI002220DDE9|nr:peptidase S8/S53 domain-containing protein [Tricharina praecox]KAI5849003.1 peptidase S8/S53 domain-containing protein [Tricharina praecox]
MVDVSSKPSKMESGPVTEYPRGDNETSEWLRRINLFSLFVKDIPDDVDKHAVVKIAIIDDGVSIEKISGTPRSISGGMSFHRRGRMGRHHFPSSNGHGTEMADCVLQVFPKAKLYIARLDTLTQGVLQAIIGAVEQKVDIILMSWTIEKTNENGAAVDKMGKAIDKASEAKILMFCAAKDGGADQGNSYGYPRVFYKPIFCVGAATQNGQRSGRIGTQDVDLLFQGENFTSLATDSRAAGLLLYCAHVGKQRPDGSEDRGRDDRRKDLKTFEKMKATLEDMVIAEKYFPAPKFFHIDGDGSWYEDEYGPRVINGVIASIEK